MDTNKLTKTENVNHKKFKIDMCENNAYIDISRFKHILKPAATLSRAASNNLAMDSGLDNADISSIFEHSVALGVYPQQGFIGYGMLHSIAQNGLIRACIDTVADDMTKNWIELKSIGLDDGKVDKELQQEKNTIIERLTEEMRRLDIQNAFHKAAGYAGYYGGCLLFIDTGNYDYEYLQYPLNISEYSTEAKQGFFKGLKVIEPVDVSPFEYDATNPLSDNYYTPKYWIIAGRKVHASRFIHIVQNEVPTIYKPAYNFFGIPQAQILWDYVMHYQQNRDSANRLLQKFSLTVMKTDMSEVLTGSPDGYNEIQNRIRLMMINQNNDGIQLLDKEREDISKVETPLSGVTDIVKQSFEAIAAINRTPAVKLLGISPSGFNATGESDIRNYYDHIKSQQEKILSKGVQTVMNLIQFSLFGKIDDSILFNFKPLSDQDGASAAMNQQAIAGTIVQLVQAGIISPEEGRKRLVLDPNSGFSGLDPDDLPEDPNAAGEEGAGADLMSMLQGGAGEGNTGNEVEQEGDE